MFVVHMVFLFCAILLFQLEICGYSVLILLTYDTMLTYDTITLSRLAKKFPFDTIHVHVYITSFAWLDIELLQCKQVKVRREL